MEKYRVLQISDMHLFADNTSTLLNLNTFASLQAVLQLIHATEPRAPDSVLLTGDLSHDGSKASYAHLVDLIQKQFSCPIYWIPGNHDNFAHMQQAFEKTAFLPDNEITLGNWKLLLSNSLVAGAVHGKIDAQDLTWLQQKVQQATNYNLITVVHHHPVPIGVTWLDKLGLLNAVDYLQIVTQHPKLCAIVFGHVHQVFAEKVDGVQYYAVPSTCIQFKPKVVNFALDKAKPGYRWFELDADGTLTTGVKRASQFNDTVDYDSVGY